MSRPVTLLATDGTTVLGNVLLPSDYPGSPAILTWKDRSFRTGNIAYGPGSPGAYENYREATSLHLRDDDVSAPDVVPTKVA
jgi:hypothetical protein